MSLRNFKQKGVFPIAGDIYDKKISEKIQLKDASIDCMLSSGIGFVTGFVLSAVFPTIDDITFAAVAGAGCLLSAFGMKTKHYLAQSTLS